MVSSHLKMTPLSKIDDFFKSFNRNFKNYEHFQKMLPVSNPLSILYGTIKTRKFEHSQDKTRENIKFNSIIDLSCTYV